MTEHEPHHEPAEVQNVRGRLTAAKAQSIVGTAQIIDGELRVRLDSTEEMEFWMEFTVRVRELLANPEPSDN